MAFGILKLAHRFPVEADLPVHRASNARALQAIAASVSPARVGIVQAIGHASVTVISPLRNRICRGQHAFHILVLKGIQLQPFGIRTLVATMPDAI